MRCTVFVICWEREGSWESYPCPSCSMLFGNCVSNFPGAKSATSIRERPCSISIVPKAFVGISIGQSCFGWPVCSEIASCSIYTTSGIGHKEKRIRLSLALLHFWKRRNREGDQISWQIQHSQQKISYTLQGWLEIRATSGGWRLVVCVTNFEKRRIRFGLSAVEGESIPHICLGLQYLAVLCVLARSAVHHSHMT